MASEEDTSSPSISIRQYLRWLPGWHTDEPTTTVVLTTSRNHYVDVRVMAPRDIDSTSILPKSIPALDLTHLDWAFAGTSSSTLRGRRLSTNSNKSSGSAIKPLTPTEDPDKRVAGSSSSSPAVKPLTPTDERSKRDAGKMIMVRECTWTHWIDSRGPMAGYIDSGTIWPTNTDNESLEKGRMLNNKGELQDMEELWRDFKPQRLPGENKMVSIVLTAENPALDTKGMVIRVGGWCQGVICSPRGREIGVERWRYGDGGFWDGIVKRYDDSAAQQRVGKWHKIFKLGNMGMPCESVCLKSMDLAEGDSLTYGGLKWTVVERELL